jgi:hypothetical protein
MHDWLATPAHGERSRQDALEQGDRLTFDGRIMM